MSITFGGLATGLDTNSIVKELMALERQPIKRLEADKSWLTSRQQAYSAFDARLKGFMTSVGKLTTAENLRQKSVSTSSQDFFSVTSSSQALEGTSYQVEVVSLAQVQKSVSEGYASKSDALFGSGELTLTVGDAEAVTINIDQSNNSLEGMMRTINEAGAGITASIINDGTDSPYRLVLTGKDSATSFSLGGSLTTYAGDVSSQLQAGGFADQQVAYFGSGTLTLSGGHVITMENQSNSLTDLMAAINAQTDTTGIAAEIVADGDNFVLSLAGGSIESTDFTSGQTGAPILTQTQNATRAHIRVDNIDIYADNNSIRDAIPGITLDLHKAEVGQSTTIGVSLNEASIKEQINDFVKGYNEVMSFISSQSVKEGSSGGILSGDSGMHNVKRRLQSFLTLAVGGVGNFSALSQLGMETQRDGTLKVNDTKLDSAIKNNLEDVEKLLAGDEDTKGIASTFQDYLQGLTHTVDGLLATNKKSTESTVKRIDSRIEQVEARLEKKEETLRSRFNALEQLVSGMNAQSNFLTQQFDLLNNMMTRKK